MQLLQIELLQRFETLAIEAQMSSQSEENMFVQDLMHTDPMSDIYQRKVGIDFLSATNAACS